MNRLSSLLAEVTSNVGFADLPAETVRAAETSLLDAVGVTLAAGTLGEGVTPFTELIISEGGKPESSLLGHGVRVPAASAAFANGAAAHALDFEDSVDGVPVHPNAQTIPAAIALAEQRDLDGKRLLTAIALGCDLTCRLGEAVGTTLANRGWYPPPIVGAIGATLACANLLGLDRGHTLDALSLAVSQCTASGEIKYSPHSVIRGIRDAFAAQIAVRSVQLAERGVTGFCEPLEGKAGFFAAFAGADYDPARIMEGLGTRFAGVRTSYKPWPSCRGTHSFIQSALHLRDGLDPTEILSIVLTGSPVNRMLAEPREAKQAPSTGIDAKFSLPFTVATALTTGRVTLSSFFPESLRDPDILALARLVEYRQDPALCADENLTVGRTLIHMKDGRVLSHEVHSPRGGPDSPLSSPELLAKFIECAVHAADPIDATRASEIAGRLLAIRAAGGLRDELGALFGTAQK